MGSKHAFNEEAGDMKCGCAYAHDEIGVDAEECLFDEAVALIRGLLNSSIGWTDDPEEARAFLAKVEKQC